MSKKRASQWSANKGLARAILLDRKMRRRVMTQFLILLLLVFALGLWGINEWLGKELMRFVLYWAACGALGLFLVIFAVFDVLAVIREERDRIE